MPYVRRTLDKKESGAVIADFEYELDKAGIRLSMKDKDGKYWAFTYDPRYQLRSETKWSQKVNGSRLYQYGWLYDPNGNRLVQHHDGVPTDYSYGLNNEMLEAGSVDFTYDHFGNTKTKVASGNTTTYSWDDEGHLLGVDYPGTTNDDSHEYDGDGKRMRSKLAGATEWREFVYDELSGEILMEYTLVGGTFAVKAVNTWGLGLISSNREGVKRYFHFDALGSTRALTDSSGNVTDTYEYNAFGVLESSTGTSVNPYRYVGQWGYYDDGAMGSSSGGLYAASGYAVPAIGAFLSPAGGGYPMSWRISAISANGSYGAGFVPVPVGEPTCDELFQKFKKEVGEKTKKAIEACVRKKFARGYPPEETIDCILRAVGKAPDNIWFWRWLACLFGSALAGKGFGFDPCRVAPSSAYGIDCVNCCGGCYHQCLVWCARKGGLYGLCPEGCRQKEHACLSKCGEGGPGYSGNPCNGTFFKQPR